MNSRLIGAALAILAWSALFPAAAAAQLYSWRDGTGALVISDRPQTGTMTTYAVTAAPQIRTTRAPISGRATAYDSLILEHSATHGVSPSLVKAVIQAESAFNPRARSVKGAMGLMQLMPATAAEYGVRNPYDPAENIRAGVAYLKSLLDRYPARQDLALAAYNAGPAAVQKYGGTVPPYRETRNYVAKINGAANAAPPAAPPNRTYRIVELINGREVVRFSNHPAPGAELVTIR